MGSQSPFAEKIVLITGGSSGIGLALAKQLAAEGARLWLTGRRPDALAVAGLEVERAGGRTPGLFPADVSDYAQVEALLAEVVRQDGLPDLVINSAGITHPGYVQDIPVAVFHRLMEVNYFGTVHVVKAVLPGMIARGSGHIVNISSAAGFLGVFGYSAYGASKYAVRGFSDVLRAEMKPYGIRVSIVFPPDTDTPQLAYETPLKPPETKIISGNAKVMSAEAVATAILKGIRRGQYIILPGFDVWLFYHLNNLLGNAVYLLMDWMVADARRKKFKAQR
ncbi:MAG: SDR family oxidoreductase [Anaerolineales bacterium]|nr:SDR family oxidoreductase [Anaerolineales bacterium]MCX7608471.1 SDR family oxidoreductase [Anaerolineales bacterium]MDW8227588.1 SDR family oxidoreductase [Anaerolineales bacterium]